MITNWKLSFDRVIKSEGGFVLSNIPGDAGGQTYAGIARVPNPDWEGWALIDKGIMPSDEMVMKFYKVKIWDKVKGDELPTGVDYLVFDFAVNAGVKQAIKLLQRSVGTPDDGLIGPATLKAVSAKSVDEIVNEYSKQKETFYRSIVERRPANAKFLKGWLNRVAHVKEFVDKMENMA